MSHPDDSRDDRSDGRDDGQRAGRRRPVLPGPHARPGGRPGDDHARHAHARVLPAGRAERPACSSGFGLTAPSGSSTTTRSRALLALGQPTHPSRVPCGADAGRTVDRRPRPDGGAGARAVRDAGGRARRRAGLARPPLHCWASRNRRPARAIRVARVCRHHTPRDPTEARTAVTLHAHLTALPGLLAEADLAEAHVEARDRRTGALVAYSFVTIDRALALHVAEAVRVGARAARARSRS